MGKIMSKLLNNDQSAWLSVYLTHSLPEAHIVKGRLEADGIPVMVHVVPGAAAMGIHIGRMGEIQVVVRSIDYERAMILLYPDENEALPPNTDTIIYHLNEIDNEADEENDERDID